MYCLNIEKGYTDRMKIAYLYERPVSEGEAMGADQTLVDYAKTNRGELNTILHGGAVRRGDTVLLRAKSDLGRGKQADRHIAELEAMDVHVEVLPVSNEVRVKGRPERAEIGSIDQFDHACSLWYSPAPEGHAVSRISSIVGQDVDRNWCNYKCGPRSASKAEQKRDVMLKKLKDTKEADHG